MILQFSLNITACVPDYHNETSFSSSSRDLIVSSSCGAFSFLPFLLFPSFFCTQEGGLVSSFFVGLLDSLYNDDVCMYVCIEVALRGDAHGIGRSNWAKGRDPSGSWVQYPNPAVSLIPRHSRRTVLAHWCCLLYTSPSPRDRTRSRMPSSA